MVRPATNLPPFRGVHGCNELNVAVLQRAVEAQAAWLVVPCCIRDGPGAHSQGRREVSVGGWKMGPEIQRCWVFHGKTMEYYGKNMGK